MVIAKIRDLSSRSKTNFKRNAFTRLRRSYNQLRLRRRNAFNAMMNVLGER